MESNTLLFGYTGAYQDPVTCGHPLGNGYRMYLPELMRFSVPDSWSPFDEGGINPYVYCAGDPINHADPTGHLSPLGWSGVITGSVGIALALGPFALAAVGVIGTEVAVGAALTTAAHEAGIAGALGLLAGAGAGVFGVLSAVAENYNNQGAVTYAGVFSTVVGVISFGFGVAGTTLYARRIVPLAERGLGMVRPLEHRVEILEAELRTAGRQVTQFTQDISGHFGLGLTTEEALAHAARLRATSEPPRVTWPDDRYNVRRHLPVENLPQKRFSTPEFPVPEETGAPPSYQSPAPRRRSLGDPNLPSTSRGLTNSDDEPGPSWRGQSSAPTIGDDDL